jgi:hypothetical protein
MFSIHGRDEKCKILSEDLKGRDHLRDLGINGKIILNGS